MAVGSKAMTMCCPPKLSHQSTES